MNVVLYMAVSNDGYVAGPKGETPWSEAEWQAYSEFVRRHGNIVVGHRTYDIMKDAELEKIGNPFVVVVSHRGFQDGVSHVVRSPIEALHVLQEKGFTTAVVGGGPTLNQVFIDENLVDEIILDIEDVQLGGGIKLFGTHDVLDNFVLSNKKIITPKLQQQHYIRRT